MPDDLSPTTRLTAELYAPVTAEASGSKAIVRVFGRIDPDGAPWGISSNDFQAALDSLPEDVTDVEIQVQTRGGDAFEGVAIMNMIRSAKQTTEAVVVGLAASAGSYIVQGADKVTMMPHSQMMIHRGSVLAVGQAPDMRMAAERLDSIDKTMANVYTEKAGGTPDEWLTAMTPETWYTADEAVAAGLADGVRSLAKTPAGAKASLDLSIFAYAGRDHAPEPFMPAARAPETPAEPPVIPSTNTKEADTMSDTIPVWLRERLELPEGADQAAAEAKLDSLEEQATKPDDTPPALDPAAIKAALEADGQTVVSKAKLDALTEQAEQGALARAKQIGDERDELIEAAMSSGKISRSDETRKVWNKEFERNFETAKADLESLPARFPVGPTSGHTGDDGTPGANAAFTDDEAAALSALAGVSKEGLLA